MKTSLITVIFLLLLTSAISAGTKSSASALSMIEQNYENGKLSLDDKVILQIDAIKGVKPLPDEYQSLSSASSDDLRQPTLILINIRIVWNQLSDDTRQYITKALARVESEFEYVSPSGFFKFHYDTTGTNNIVSPLDTNSNGVSDYVERCAAYCDTAYYKHLELGYLIPPSDASNGGDSLYDVYFENMIYYGYAVPEGMGDYPWNDFYSFLVLHNTFAIFEPNDDPEGDIAGAAKATAAHEYHHSVQFAYDIYKDNWFMESDATYFEDIVFDNTNDNYLYLPTFFDAPNISLTDNGTHAYSCFIWEMFLAERYDTTMLVSIWEAAITTSIVDATNDYLMANYSTTIDSAFVQFVYWNFITGSRNDNLHYSEAANYPEILFGATQTNFPVSLRNSPSTVNGYGSSYINFNTGPNTGKLRLTFNGSNTRQWKALAIKTTSGNQHELEYFDLDTNNFNGTLDIYNIENYSSITLVGINLDEFSTGALFTYSAEILPIYEVASELTSLPDSVVYSGGLRTVTFQVHNPSDVNNDVYDIIFWDDLGWRVKDTISRSIFSNDSSTFEIDIKPPVGTPLGWHSDIKFVAQSWNDSAVVDTQSFKMVTVLYHGDCNFDGVEDISDLLWLVDYAFLFGPDPLPNKLSGDYNCDQQVDISDLLLMVDHFFNFGPQSPCNPY